MAAAFDVYLRSMKPNNMNGESAPARLENTFLPINPPKSQCFLALCCRLNRISLCPIDLNILLDADASIPRRTIAILGPQYRLITHIIACDTRDGARSANPQLWIRVGEPSVGLARFVAARQAAQVVAWAIAAFALLLVGSFGGIFRTVECSAPEGAEDGNADAHEGDGHFGGGPDDQGDSVNCQNR